MDTTGRILAELEIMVKDGEFSTKPQLEKQITELITKINENEINLFDYRQFDSKERFGVDLIKAISKAHSRQQQKHKSQ